MSGMPPTPFQTIWILARLATRRWFNRAGAGLFAAFRRKKKPGRTATPRKRLQGGFFAVVIGLAMFFGGFTMAARLVVNLSDAVKSQETVADGRLEVRAGVYWRLRMAERVRQEAIRKREPVEGFVPLEEIERSGMASDETGTHEFENLREDLAYTLGRYVRKSYNLQGEEADRLVTYWLDTFEKRGLEGFKEKQYQMPTLAVSTRDWLAPGHVPQFLRGIGLVLALCAVTVFFMSLTLAAWSTGQVAWNMEWLYSFPIRSRTILLAKVLEYALLNVLSHIAFISLFLALFLIAGYAWLSIPLALAFALGVGLLIASLVVLTETWIRLKVNRNHQKNLQAASNLMGMLAMFAAMFLAYSPRPPAWFLDIAKSLPNAILWFPTSIPSQVCLGGGTAWIASVSMVAIVVVFGWGCVRTSEWLVRRGLIAEAGSYRGVRGAPRSAQSRSRPSRMGGIVGKELKFLVRDKNRLISIMVLPLFMIGMNLFMYEGTLGKIGGNFTHASALAFGIGVYVLLLSAFQVLAIEQKAVWLLFTFPKPLHSVLLSKTFLWIGVGLVYPIAVLVGAAVTNGQPSIGMISDAALVVIGVVIYAFIASGLGVLGTDPLEPTPQQMQRTSYLYLYMLLAAMFASAFYNPSAWGRISQVVLASLLAMGIWQKVRHRIPFLLDPTESPPPRVDLSDGLIAVLAFFSIQGGVLSIVTVAGKLPMGPGLLIAYSVSGLVVAVATLFVYWRAKVPDLLITLGIHRKDPTVSLTGSLANGLLWGMGAAAVGVGHLWLIERIEPLRSYRDELLRLSTVKSADLGLWLIVLGIFLAPIFEEYIFRGLVFRGLQRSFPKWAAVVASATLFALVHPPISFIPVFTLGIATAMCYARTRWLVPPILAHCVYNAVVFGAN